MSDGNQRAHGRQQVAIPVAVAHQGHRIEGVSRNVSLGGMFIVCLETVPFGATVELTFALPAIDAPVVVSASVRWVEPTTGIGVQFAGLRAVEVWALQKLIADNDTAVASEG